MNLTITPSAAAKITELLADQDDKTYLRVYVQGGGCSGFQYGFAFDEVSVEEDHLLLVSGARIAVDAMSSQYLETATIDYVEELMGAHFEIKNPNATTTCGCGSSFSV